jgi:hypothetical protein
MQMARDSEGWNILFYAYKQRVFPSVMQKNYLVNNIDSFNKTIRMKKKTIQKKSKEFLSIERKIKYHLKASMDGYESAKSSQKKNWYAGAYTSLSLLLDSINNK